MAIETKQTGATQTDNVVNPVLGFNTGSTWTNTGQGSASVSLNQFFNGSGSLYIENTRPTTELTASNTTQSTAIPKDGDYYLSFELYKTIADTVLTGDIQIFKGSTLYNTQSFSIGSATTADDKNSQWVRFIANTALSFDKGDVFTIKIKINGIDGTSLNSTTLYVDGIKLEANDKGNFFPSVYSPPINATRTVNASGQPTVANNTYVDWMALADGTLNSTSYGEGDVLRTVKFESTQKTFVITDFSS